VSRPAAPLITRERAARAALGVIDVQGLEGLSLELVARRLGVKAPSLYYHFRDKASLLEEVARLILVESGTPRRIDNDWKGNLIRLCVGVRRSILQHPNAAPLLLQFFPRHLLLPTYDRAVADYPFPVEYHMMMIEGLEKLTFGSAFFEAAARARSVEPMPEFDPDELPHLAEAIRANVFDDEELFVETLETFILGSWARLKTDRRVSKNGITVAKKRRPESAAATDSASST
jgi:TetR/AcrR family transcriptional regulator, tetracycline repressor protein